MAKFNGKMLGRRRVALKFVVEDTPPPRGRLLLVGAKKHLNSQHIKASFSSYKLAPDVEPELLLNEEGLMTGEVILTFQDIPSAVQALQFFNSKPNDLSFKDATMLLPLRFDELTEKWVESENSFHENLS
mmetsp:Transcript_37089/g.116689  ORF Transcript_37089/g.116689 Transcript_37089/m.116689 type:complete len:130 (+) Transcript_37089:1718-2107(+)